jgi:hypothetical protein
MSFKKHPICSIILITILPTVIFVKMGLSMLIGPKLLTDPFLQMPGKRTIRVVWFTELKGIRHYTTYGSELNRIAKANTTLLSRIRDEGPDGFINRRIWRHESLVADLTPSVRTPYFVTSIFKDGQKVKSDIFSLQPMPKSGQRLKILLTSDHQQKPMIPANLQKVVETVGMIDAVFFAGDLINIADNAKEWFDDSQGLGFFAALQGRTRVFNSNHPYKGGSILQYAPIFPCIGNHEVMGTFDGRFADFDKGRPRWYAEIHYKERLKQAEKNHTSHPHKQRVQDKSFNTVTYKEIFSLPAKAPGGELYYDLRFGDICLAALFVTRHWRTPRIDEPKGGKFHEGHPNDPESWLFGDFIFEDFGIGSNQYKWLLTALQTPECIDAKYRLIMSHQTSRGPGGNSVPLLSQQVMKIEFDHPDHGPTIKSYNLPPDPKIWHEEILPGVKKAKKIRYDYPRQRDQWRLHIEPVLADAGIHLVLHGHSHLWYRMRPRGGPIYLETSNVGNSYGAYLRDYQSRKNVPPPDSTFWNPKNYAATEDPYGVEAEVPTIFSPMVHQNHPLPTVDSNKLTVFSILDTASGTISSYVFDTTHPEDKAIKFDEFAIRQDIKF